MKKTVIALIASLMAILLFCTSCKKDDKDSITTTKTKTTAETTTEETTRADDNMLTDDNMSAGSPESTSKDSALADAAENAADGVADANERIADGIEDAQDNNR